MTHQNQNIESAQTDLSPEFSVAQRERMRALIAELVHTNQELRFKITQLKEKIARLEKGLPEDILWTGMLI